MTASIVSIKPQQTKNRMICCYSKCQNVKIESVSVNFGHKYWCWRFDCPSFIVILENNPLAFLMKITKWKYIVEITFDEQSEALKTKRSFLFWWFENVTDTIFYATSLIKNKMFWVRVRCNVGLGGLDSGDCLLFYLFKA